MGANLEIRLKGLVWGGGFEWETVVYDVSPISYAQCGLYFQFHRPEAQVYSNLRYLMEKRHAVCAEDKEPSLTNICAMMGVPSEDLVRHERQGSGSFLRVRDMKNSIGY